MLSRHVCYERHVSDGIGFSSDRARGNSSRDVPNPLDVSCKSIRRCNLGWRDLVNYSKRRGTRNDLSMRVIANLLVRPLIVGCLDGVLAQLADIEHLINTDEEGDLRFGRHLAVG